MLAFLLNYWAEAQSSQPLSLPECYEMARANYPLIKRLDLLAKTTDFDIQNANNRYLPQLSFSGQATYQSQTIDFAEALSSSPIGLNLPPLSKDQYKIVGEVTQLIYDGGSTRHQVEISKANSALQQQHIENNLYTLKQRINNIFFSILLMDAQLKQNELNKASLQTQVQKTEAAFANGIAFRSNERVGHP